ncbi:hypothetical protein EV144_10121 [Flavobacterium sp. 270]|uniref:hypothetical protein n=1 Tax=Flavobacterium sp. 270 TaxID=2512114 RepID=UPI0010646B58|nr:hypothetical protein [Flavobacterium sp. 270]TDW51349.1 hypothetical protein EV144_10121 [Flavobacterium sp. 270]
MIKYIRQVLIILTLFSFVIVYAHKDRIEIPQSFVFTLKSKEVIRFNSSDSKLEKFCEDIVSKKVELSEVQLYYKTGEVVTVQSDGVNWTLLKITFRGKSLYVPENKIKKISEIHFSTLNLFWSGESNAFNSHYLCLRFYIGTKRSFDVFPNLELHFENRKFSKAEVWVQTSENSRHGKAF